MPAHCDCCNTEIKKNLVFGKDYLKFCGIACEFLYRFGTKPAPPRLLDSGVKHIKLDNKRNYKLGKSPIDNIMRKPHKGTNYRNKALQYYGEQCMSCGYVGERIDYDVDHIDSNRKNNDISNLQVLCAICHARKTRKRA